MKKFNFKKLAFGIPSILSIALTLFISYVFYFGFLPSHAKKVSTFSAMILGILHTFFATMTLWSLIKTMLSDPGYLPNSYYKNVRNYQEVVNKLNKKHYQKNNLIPIPQETEEDEEEGRNVGINGNDNLSSDSTDELDSDRKHKNAEIISQASTEVNSLGQRRNSPDDPELAAAYWKAQEEQVDTMFDEQVRSFIRFRYCHKCKQVKPPRTHHCSVCDQCVMRMDHHCPWVGNCVGIHNHKFFWNFLIYSCLGTTNVCLALFLSKNSINELQKDVPYMLAAVFSLAFSVSIAFLFAVHTYMLMRNLSTLEMGGLMIKNPFHKGSIRANLEYTLGKDWRFWLIPIEPTQRVADGINHSLIPSY